MITFPTLRGRPIEWSFDPMPFVYASNSGESLSGQVIETLGTPWMCRMVYAHLDADDSDLMRSFLDRMQGLKGVTRLSDVRRPAPRGTITGAPQIDGADQTGMTLLLKNMTPGQTWAVGDYLEHSNTLHRTTAAATVDGAGKVSLAVYPPIISPTINNAVVTLITPSTFFRLRQNFNPLTTAAPLLPRSSQAVTLEFVESMP